MKNKLTIVKVLDRNGVIASPEDIERWREIFRQKRMTLEEAAATGEVGVETIPPFSENENYITLVKVGDENYSPSIEDLETWRNVFEDAKNDPDFKIFTHPAVEIHQLSLGEIIQVE